MIRRARFTGSVLTGILFFVLSVSAAAQEGSVSLGHLLGQTPYTSPSCAGSDHHEMDFMAGVWDMKVLVDGRWQPGGFSIIRPALGGCAWLEIVSQENWGELYRPLTGRSGFGEITISSYDKQANNWRHIRLDDMGAVVTDFRGRKYPDGIRFVGPGPDHRSAEMQRFEWKMIGEGLREMIFEQSKNGGQSWSRIATVQMVKRDEKAPDNSSADPAFGSDTPSISREGASGF